MSVSMCNACKLFNKDLNYCAFSVYIGDICPNFTPNWEDNMNTPMLKAREIKPPEIKIVITTMLELPEYCYNCPCHDGENDRCRADTEGRTSIYRPFWCPLREEKNKATVYRGE